MNNPPIMPILTIPRQLTTVGELVVIPKKEYQGFLELQKMLKKRMAEEHDTDRAIVAYKSEKQKGTLRSIASLRELR